MLYAKSVSFAFLSCVILLKLFTNPLLNVENMISRIQDVPDDVCDALLMIACFIAIAKRRNA